MCGLNWEGISILEGQVNKQNGPKCILTENDWHNVTFLNLDSSILTPFLQASTEEEQNKKEI